MLKTTQPPVNTVIRKPRYLVVHPLDDIAERKIDTRNLGPMPMTRTVRWSLFTLRLYLILMIGLVLFRVARLAGV